jgi:hypothetical protein
MRAHWYVDEEGKAMQDALWKMSAAAQAEAVRSAEVSAVELVDSHLDRIAEVNPQVNAVTQLLAERAREAAAQTDRQRAAGEALGPLAGVPFTVKESTAVEGVPTTFGTEPLPPSFAIAAKLVWLLVRWAAEMAFSALVRARRLRRRVASARACVML